MRRIFGRLQLCRGSDSQDLKSSKVFFQSFMTEKLLQTCNVWNIQKSIFGVGKILIIFLKIKVGNCMFSYCKKKNIAGTEKSRLRILCTLLEVHFTKLIFHMEFTFEQNNTWAGIINIFLSALLYKVLTIPTHKGCMECGDSKKSRTCCHYCISKSYNFQA